MRVWITGERWGELGERQYEVSWWVVKKPVLDDPKFQSGERDFDPDNDAYEKFEIFKTKADADARAQHVANTHDDLCWGGVMVQEQVVDWFVREDNVAEWQNVGDSEEFTAELTHA